MDSIILDERMTEETKNFVRDALKTKKVGEFIHVEPAITRRKQLDAALKANESIKLENIKITEFTVKNKFDNFEIPVTCYMPEKVHDNYSINLFFHGGGWTFGSVDTYKYSVYLLAESTKSCWLSVEYRLAPENRFPTQINDCISVFEWVFENKLKFGMNYSQFVIV
jgi:acetyl esterase/lipase